MFFFVSNALSFKQNACLIAVGAIVYPMYGEYLTGLFSKLKLRATGPYSVAFCVYRCIKSSASRAAASLHAVLPPSRQPSR